MEIKIAGYQIKAKNVDNLVVDAGNLGEYSPIAQEIRLDTSLTIQQRQEVFVHEILEAINSIYDLNLDHDNQLCKLSVVLHQILVDNPGLVELCGGKETTPAGTEVGKHPYGDSKNGLLGTEFTLTTPAPKSVEELNTLLTESYKENRDLRMRLYELT